MIPIAKIVTRAQAEAIIKGIEVPKPDPKADPAAQAAAAREATLTEQFKAFALARLAAVPPDVQVVGIDLRANSGPGETAALRIILHG